MLHLRFCRAISCFGVGNGRDIKAPPCMFLCAFLLVILVILHLLVSSPISGAGTRRLSGSRRRVAVFKYVETPHIPQLLLLFQIHEYLHQRTWEPVRLTTVLLRNERSPRRADKLAPSAGCQPPPSPWPDPTYQTKWVSFFPFLFFFFPSFDCLQKLQSAVGGSRYKPPSSRWIIFSRRLSPPRATLVAQPTSFSW